MKKPTKKLSLTTQTIRNLQSGELARVVGGSLVGTSGTSTIHPNTTLGQSTSVISRNPSGGLPSGGLPSGGIVGH
jgi:hypothetical protein